MGENGELTRVKLESTRVFKMALHLQLLGPIGMMGKSHGSSISGMATLADPAELVFAKSRGELGCHQRLRNGL
jgi:hypothetical protein